MKFLTIFSRYGTAAYRGTDARLRADLARLIPETDREFIIVDTALPENTAEEHGEYRLFGSSNAFWEFGGWATALAKLGGEARKFDFIQLATSALYESYTNFHQFLSDELLRRFAGRACALGHIDVYDKPVYLHGIKHQAWLNSSWIILPAQEALLLGNPVSNRDEGSFFSDDPKNPFAPDAPLCPQYKKYLLDWLTGSGTGQGQIWHGRFELTRETFPLFRKKTMAILNEMSLSRRLSTQGCKLADMTWASRHPDAAIPSWHEQLVTRGTGHEHIIEG